MTKHSTAHYLLEGLMDAGIDHVFANFGTDHVSIIEELANWKKAGRRHPNILLCPHENVAMHMAAGYAWMTGRGQGVMVHVDAGTANAAMGMHNLFRARLPVFLMAGKAPFTIHGELPGTRDNYVHFVQDPFDIAGLVRPFSKWEYNLPSGVIVKEVLQRGAAMMQSDPPGPVYMTLPRETLAETWEESAVASYSQKRYGPVSAGGTDATRARAIADAIMKAKNPIAVTSYLGRKPEAVAVFDEFTRTCGIKVYEYSPCFNSIPHDSPCFAGYDPAPAIPKADVGLLLDVDVPWLPCYVADNPNLRWIQVDVDAIKKNLPMWGFPAEVRVEGDCATVLGQVLEIIRAEATPAFKAAVAARMAEFERVQQERMKAIAEAGAKPGEKNAINPDFLCAQLNKFIRPQDVIMNEAVRNAPSVLNHISRTQGGTLMGLPGSGLGYSGGTALGVKLAKPDVNAIQMVGDGGYHFSNPTAVYAVAQQYKLPILTVVFDNGGWKAVKEAVLRVYPDGSAKAAQNFQSRLEGQQRRFEQVAQAFGAHGECVVDPQELEAAIARAMSALAKGQAAVLNVQVTPQ